MTTPTRYIDLTFLFAEPDEAEAFIDDCSELDYQTELGEYDGDDDRYRWRVNVTHRLDPQSSAMTSLELTLRSLALRRGGRYAGWA